MRALLALSLGCCALAGGPPKQLVVERPSLHQYEDGPDLPSTFVFASGETVFYDFQLTGFEATEEGKINLTWASEVRDPVGAPLVEPNSGRIATDLAPEDKKWKPKARASFVIPPQALSGTYKILISAKDELGMTSEKAEVGFQVKGRAVDLSDTLAIRNLSFYRTEEAPKPLEVAAYRAGDNLWIRFDIVGFKLGEKNAYDVDYGVAVLRENGESLFAQPEAAAERGDSFYPRRYIPAGLSLNLQKDIHKGPYTVVITVRDKTGNQQAEARANFTVE